MDVQRKKSVYSFVPNWFKRKKSSAGLSSESESSEIAVGSSAILAHGSWTSHGTATIKWTFTQTCLSFLTSYVNGRNETNSVNLEDIVSLRLLELSMPDNFAIYLVYKDTVKNTLSVCLIPDFSKNSKNEFASINSAWNTCRINAMHGVDSDDIYKIIWSGFRKTNSETFVYAFNRKSISYCRLYSQTVTIRFSHISDLLFDCLPESTVGRLTIKYAGYIAYNSEEIVEHNLEIVRFGTEKDFEELSLLWRQELQLQLIEEAFGDSNSADTKLSFFARDKRDVDKILQTLTIDDEDETGFEKLSTAQKRPKSISLRRADSMRRIYRPTDLKQKNYPTPSSTPCTELAAVPEDSAISEDRRDGYCQTEKPPTPEKSLTRQRSYSDTFASVKAALSESVIDDLSKRRKTERLDRSILPERRPGRRLTTVAFQPKIPDTFVAIFGYPDAGVGEMTLQKHDRVRIVRKDPSGWWYALKLLYKQDGVDMRWVVIEEGWIPSNYLKPYIE